MKCGCEPKIKACNNTCSQCKEPHIDERAASLADAIVDDLFEDGFGDVAQRLVLDVPGLPLAHGGGWSKVAVRAVILKHLSR